MPLIKGASDAAFRANVKAEQKAGKPMDQAVAIALDVKRKAGGKVPPKPKRKAKG